MSAPSVPPMRSRVGLNVEGDNLVWGRSVRRDLVGRVSFTGVIVLSVTGRLPSREACDLLDDFVTSFQATDTRVWPLKVGRIVASFGKSAAGFCAGQLACASETLGPLIAGEAAWMLHDLRERLGERDGDPSAVEDEVAKLLAQGRRLAGFGAPFRPEDERLTALRECIRRRGQTGLRHYALAEQVAAAGKRLRGLEANIVLHAGALALDVGLAPGEVGDVMLGLAVPLLLGTAREGALRREPQLRELPADAVEYCGPAPCSSPRAGQGR